MSPGQLSHQGTRLPSSLLASFHLRTVAVSLVMTASYVAAQQVRPVQQARAKQFVEQRISPQGAGLLLHARMQSALMPRAATTSLTSAWQPLGPNSILSSTFGNLSGRITALAADPNDASGNTLYVGTTGGGVWRSGNVAGGLGSVTLQPLTDTQASLSIGAVAVQPKANPVVLAGTGDPNDATDSYYGEGILRSTDGGTTWSLVTESHDGVNGNHSFAGLATAGVAFSTSTPMLVVAAMSTSPQAAVVSATNTTSIPGLYYSTDAGATWQMSTLYDGAAVVQQPLPLGSIQPGNAATSVTWDGVRQRFYAAVRGHGYYSSADGATWQRLAVQPGAALTTTNCPVGVNGAGSSSCPIFRGVITAQPVTGDLYALTVDANDQDQGLWQDLCNASNGACATTAPTFAARIDNGALEASSTIGIAQGSYNLALAAAPVANNGTVLFVGTVDLYRCSMTMGSASCALRNTTNALNGCNAPAAVAPAQHAVATASQTSGMPIVYLGNDGGLWRSLDGVAETGGVCAATDKTHFDNLNGAFTGSIAEVVAFAQHPTDANTLLVGLGANGSAATTNAAALAPWPQLSAGEGGYPQLDPNSTSDWFLSVGAGVNVAACTLGASCMAADFLPPATIGAAQTSYDASLLDAPSLLDPSLTTNLLIATCRVWRGPAGSGSTWSASNAISPALDGSATPCTASSPLIRSLGAGGPSHTSSSAQFAGSPVIYAGVAGALDGGGSLGGHLFVTSAANMANAGWTDAALSPVTNDTANASLFNPRAFDISSIAVDTHDATGATVYATVMGFGYPHVYRSIDFGAHWLNVSSNLPDAPANAVLVDPNSANTVYVAMDTGVYVTQSVTTCTTSNCWSLLGTGLPNALAVSLEAAANMPTGAGTNGVLRAATYGRGIWATPLITASSPTQPAVTLSLSSLSFAATQVSTQSAAQSIVVTSSGTSPLTISSITTSGDFTEADTCAGQTLAIKSSCSISVTFTPSTTGARSGVLTVFANVATGQATVALSGTGTAAPAIVFTPTSLSFASTIVNQATAAQIITVANTGGTTATLQTPIISGPAASDFAITANTCTSTLAPSTACALGITFTPSGSGTRTATLALTDSAGTQSAALSGTGKAPATDTLSANALTFAQQPLNTTSAVQQVTLTNAGGVALTLISTSVSAGDFAVTNACGNSLAANSTCAVTVSFTPTAVGTRTATLTVSDQFRMQTVVLTGVGVAPPGVSLAPTSLSFPATGVSLTAPAQTLTLTNNGGLPLTLGSAAVSPNFAVAATTCASSLAVNAACTYTIVFAPTVVGAIAGQLTLSTNAAVPTQTISLAGTGVDFALSPTGATSATLSSGANGGAAIYTLQLSSLSTLSGNIALACSGVPASSTCVISPPAASLGNTTPLVVTVATGTTIAGMLDRWRRGPTDIFLAMVLPLAFAVRKRRRVLRLSLLLLALAGCATGRIVPPPTAVPTNYVPTPTGTYNLTVSATSAGLTHSVPLTLTVQ